MVSEFNKVNFESNGQQISGYIMTNDISKLEDTDALEGESLHNSKGYIDLLLNINTKGRYEFQFSAELALTFSYRFTRGRSDEESRFITRKDKTVKFRLAAPVVNPFDFLLDYQILNPLLKFANYESNNLIKRFIVQEKSLVVFSLENKSSHQSPGHRIILEELSFKPNLAEPGIVSRLGQPLSITGAEVEPLEHTKLNYYFTPLQPKVDYSLGEVLIRWRRAPDGSANNLGTAV